MAMETVTGITYRCDQPTCDVAHTVEAQDAPEGYFMEVLVPDAHAKERGQGRQVEVYACQLTHVRGAVEAVTAPVRRVDGGPRGRGSNAPAAVEAEPGAAETSGDEDPADELDVAEGSALEPADA